MNNKTTNETTQNVPQLKKIVVGLINTVIIVCSIFMLLIFFGSPFSFSHNFLFKRVLFITIALIFTKLAFKYVQGQKKTKKIKPKYSCSKRVFSNISWFYSLMTILLALCHLLWGTSGPSSANQLILFMGLPMYFLYFPLLFIEIICTCFNVCRLQSVLLLLTPLFIVKFFIN